MFGMKTAKVHGHSVVTALLLGCVAAPAVSAEWAAFRGNQQRTGYCSLTVGLPAGNPAWVFGPVGPVVSSPSVVEGVVYFGSRDNTIYAVSLSTGKMVWKKRTPGWVDSSPLIYGDSLVVGCRAGRIYVLDRHTGDSLGIHDGGLQLSSPAALSDGSILSLVGHPRNAFSRYRPGEFRSSWSLFFPQPMYSSPAVSGNMVVFGGNDGALSAVDIRNRTVKWSTRTRGTTYLSSPAIDDSLVFFAPGDLDRSVYAVWLSDGQIYWKSSGKKGPAKARKKAAAEIPAAILVQLRQMSPLQRRKWLEYYQSQGVAFAHKFRLGKRRGDAPTTFVPNGLGVRTSSVAVDDNNVYVIQRELGVTGDLTMAPVSRFTLLALEKSTGNEMWRFTDLRHSILLGYNSSPVVTPGYVLFGWGEGKVYALEKQSGKRVLWQDSLSGDVVASPAIGARRAIFATMDGYVCAYDLTATALSGSFKEDTYCYPNPAREGISHIQVFVERRAKINIVVYTVAEEPVFRVSAEVDPAKQNDDVNRGKYTYDWNVKDAANGVYFALVKIRYRDCAERRKVLKIAVLN